MVDRSSDRTTGGVRAPIVRRITAMFDRFRPFTRFLPALPFSPASAVPAWRIWHVAPVRDVRAQDTRGPLSDLFWALAARKRGHLQGSNRRPMPRMRRQERAKPGPLGLILANCPQTRRSRRQNLLSRQKKKILERNRLWLNRDDRDVVPKDGCHPERSEGSILIRIDPSLRSGW